MLLCHLLFKTLRRRYAAYYKSVGSPLIFAPVNLQEGDYRRLLKGASFAYAIVFKGTPAHFPKNEKPKRQAYAIRLTLALALTLIIPLVVSLVLLYKATT